MNIIVQTFSEEDTRGLLICGEERFDCALGRTGVTIDKKEGDGKTPVGTYPLRYAFYRADRMGRPDTGLETVELTPETGWCEDPSHPDYNSRVTLPHAGAVDRMTREDHLYDITVVIGYNDDPPATGKGSAIFMHLAREGLSPTAGCVALAEDDLRKVLKKVGKNSTITILPPPKR